MLRVQQPSSRHAQSLEAGDSSAASGRVQPFHRPCMPSCCQACDTACCLLSMHSWYLPSLLLLLLSRTFCSLAAADMSSSAQWQ